MTHSPSSGALLDLAPAEPEFFEQTVAGLSKSPRTLPCKFFYDERGATLFQQICELPEYYITRTELQILRLQGASIAGRLGGNVELIGLGTGAGTKTRILLEELDSPAVYIPIDISREQLQVSTARFRQIFPDLQILPVCADYLEEFELPLPRRTSTRSVVYFPGSTIGNFEPQAAIQFMRRMADLVGAGGGLLIGVDLRKDRRVIRRAYNDRQGVTAAFNLNLLERANRELDANFNLQNWTHRARYNAVDGRIEMYLVSEIEQTVSIGYALSSENPLVDAETDAERTPRSQTRLQFHFGAGEKILTEHSYKHTPDGFADLACQAGFTFEQLWTDPKRLFGVFYFTAAS